MPRCSAQPGVSPSSWTVKCGSSTPDVGSNAARLNERLLPFTCQNPPHAYTSLVTASGIRVYTRSVSTVWQVGQLAAANTFGFHTSSLAELMLTAAAELRGRPLTMPKWPPKYTRDPETATVNTTG